MDPIDLPDDLRDLEHELQNRPRQPLSTSLRGRIEDTVEQALARPKTRRWQYAALTGAAAALLLLLTSSWPTVRQGSSQRPIDPAVSTNKPDRPEAFAFTLQTCRAALNQSPGALDELLDRPAADLYPPDEFTRAKGEQPNSRW